MLQQLCLRQPVPRQPAESSAAISPQNAAGATDAANTRLWERCLREGWACPLPPPEAAWLPFLESLSQERLEQHQWP